MKISLALFLYAAFLNLNSMYSQLRPHELRIACVANEVFLLQSSNHKVLIDALFTDGSELFALPPNETIDNIMNAKVPFDIVDLFFLTHYHKDPCDPSLIVEYLKKNPDVRLVTNKPSLVFIDGNIFGFVMMKKQFYDITPELNQSISQTINSIPVKACGLKHLSFYQNGIDLEEYMYNAGYLFDMDGIKKENLQDFIERMEHG
jgi:hypothetical protein